MSKILITGSESGLGNALVQALMWEGHEVYGFDHHLEDDVRNPAPRRIPDELDVLINCAGVNHQDWLEDMTPEAWARVMDTNALGILRMAQACLPALKASRGTILNITSNAAWTPMTCSIAYNASKAAAHAMTLQMARELTKKYGITVFGVAPNKLRGTGMSRTIEADVLRTRGWAAEFAAQYQKNALLTGEETDPAVLAEFIAFLLSKKSRHSQLSGCIIPYGA